MDDTYTPSVVLKKLLFKLLLCVSLVTFFIVPTVMGAVLSDNFDDNFIDSLIWSTVNTTGNFLINETGGQISMSGNTTGDLCTGGEVYMQSLAVLNASSDGFFEIVLQPTVIGGNANDHFGMAISDHVIGNGWFSAPPTYCGVVVDARGDQFRVTRNYPSAALITNLGVTDTDEHRLRVTVSRTATATVYEVFWDGTARAVSTQVSACSSPNLNVTFFACSNQNNLKTTVFDDFLYEASFEVNGTGAGCNTHDDCDCGFCDSGFCRPRLANEPCTKNSCCLSLQCSNLKCTRPAFTDQLELAIGSSFGTDSESFNFISMFFMIGIPVIVVFLGRSLVAIAGAIVMYFGLAFFFTLIGWLSPFILIGSVVAGLILVVLAFTMGMSGG